MPALHLSGGIRVLRLALLILMLLAVSPATVPMAAQQPLSLSVDAPASVRANEPVLVTLNVTGSTSIAAYEATLLFDHSIVHLSELDLLHGFARKAGGAGALGAVEVSSGIVFGAYTCPLQLCVDPTLPLTPTEAGGTTRLAAIALAVEQPGVLELRFEQITLVDQSGNVLQVPAPAPLTIQVGPGGPQIAAPALDPLLSSTTPNTQAQQNQPDLTGDGQVTYADLAEAALAWTEAREQGRVCGGSTYDVNGDGCTNIVDLQLVLSQAQEDTHPARQSPGTYIVDTASDESDAQIGDGVCRTSAGSCTLRAAIAEANAHSGPDTIGFQIPGSGVIVIRPTKRLPTLSDTSGPTTIDGYTQPGAQANTDPLVSNAVLRIQLEGAGETEFDGLVMSSKGNVIRGLALLRFHSAIVVYGSAGQDNRIAGNFIGTDAAGGYYAAATDGGASGVKIQQGGDQNIIGGVAPAERNVISGNAHNGVALYNEGTDQNRVINNLIGLSPTGNTSLPNRNHGVDINSGASSNEVGGGNPGEGNVVSGNGYEGVEVSHGRSTSFNSIIGNNIGTDVTGNSAAAYTVNVHFGVRLEDGARATTVEQNVIGNNHGGGISIDGYYSGYYSSENSISNNRIGISLNGTPIPNRNFGIQLDNHAYQNRIGPGNTIAHHPTGLRIVDSESDRNTITQNSIFSNSGLGIDIQPLGQANPNDAGDSDQGGNEQLNMPVITSATPTEVAGTACGGCTVEFFLTDRRSAAYGQGQRYLTTVTAGGSGSFAVQISGIVVGEYLTATATDADGNTSEFAANRAVTEQPVGPDPTAQPTAQPPVNPTAVPTAAPTAVPTSIPSVNPNQVALPLVVR